MSEDFFKKYTSHFIWKVCVREWIGDRTELQYIDSHSYGHLHYVFLVLQMLLLGASLSGCWLPLPHLVTNGSGLQTPDFLSSPSYIIVQSPTQSLERHVWSSSSGNNCHAVHRSLSSGASVYDCTAGFYLVLYCQPDLPTPIEYALPPSLEWHVWRGGPSKVNILYIHTICIL